ncbi:MAG TPA: methyltransferase [Myxococcales bacterium]|nr:methyltransferase [Myxococcales bacterium]HAN31765.1 methyltransferase [Myxococcales bacterium]|tara:strand:+ start:299 stop:1108 length:810 start_codon:yes stop_codon:yes gene_type:complete
MGTIVRLEDGLKVACLRRSEARVLDHHVRGYLDHGIQIRRGDVVFDIGANIGLFAVRAVSVPEVRVFAFEPIPTIFKVLQTNAQMHGGGRLKPMPFGISKESGQLTFTYFPNSPALSSAHMEDWDKGNFEEAVRGQIEVSGDVMWYARLVPSFLSSLIARYLKRGSQQVNCELQTVSEVMRQESLSHIDLLKIDCEGAELDVLLGIDDDHWPHIGRVVAEVHDLDGRLDDIIEILGRHGFSNIHQEKEEGFEQTPLVNIYASRQLEQTE